MADGNVITIKNLIDSGVNEYINYKNQVVISYIKSLSLFREPCHLKAVCIFVCISGEMEGYVNMQKYNMGKYSVLLTTPEQIIQNTKARNLKAFAILFSAEYVQTLSSKMLTFSHNYTNGQPDSGAFVLPREEIDNLSHFLSIFRKTMESSFTSASEDLMMHLASSFLTNIMLLYQHYHVTSNSEVNTSKSVHRIMDKFVELLGIYHTQERELRFYADKMCITPKYLSNVVKKMSNKKATDWISDFVILEAKSLLRYSGKTIQEVSLQLNFPSQSAFGKYFKTKVGISPSEYVDRNTNA